MFAECCDSVVNTSLLCAGCIVSPLSCCGEGLDISSLFAVRCDSVVNTSLLCARCIVISLSCCGKGLVIVRCVVILW